MKAIVATKYGSPDDLQFLDVPKPSPKDDEVLVKVHAASVNAADNEILRGEWSARFGGPFRPQHKIFGSDVAGRVEAVGKDVRTFQPGDDVWADLSFPYSYSTFAEYVCESETAFSIKPASMTFEEASTYPQAAIIPLQSFRDKAQLRPGQQVLINGAGGGMGTFGVQLAKYYGAEVTGVDSVNKLDMLRSLGADYVMDYLKQDYTRTGVQYDLVIDVVARRSLSDYRRALKPGGMFMIVGGSWQTFLQIMTLGTLYSRTGDKYFGINKYDANNKDDLAILGKLYESEDVLPVIDKRYPLSETAEALRYIGKGAHLGKVVITME